MRNHFLLTSFAILLALTACDKNDVGSQDSTPSKVEKEKPLTQNMREAFDQYPKTIAILWTNVAKSTKQLLNAVNTFLDEPNEQHLKNARLHFQKVSQAYFYTAAFSSGIANETTNVVKRFYPGSTQIAYIMGSPEYPHSGLVNDLAFSMELKALTQQQEMAWPEENSLGLSVLEILLYAPANPVESFQPVRKWSSEIALPIRDHPNNRLREYLKLVASQLHADAVYITKQWQGNEAEYLKIHASRSVYKKLVQQATSALYGLIVLNTGERDFPQLEPVDLSLGKLSDSDTLWLKPILTSVELALLNDLKADIKSPKLLDRMDTSNDIKQELITRAEKIRTEPTKQNVKNLLQSLAIAIESI